MIVQTLTLKLELKNKKPVFSFVIIVNLIIISCGRKMLQ